MARKSRYKVQLAPAAKKQIKKLSKPIQKKVVKRLEELKDDPRPAGVEKLTDTDNLYRIRLGDYRIIYTIEDEVLLVLVVTVADRREVYRLLKRL